MAGAKVRGITIDLGVDASGVASGLKNVNKSISTTSKELRDIEKLLKLDPSNVTLLAQKQQALQRQLTQTRDKLDLLKKAEEELKSKMVDGGTEEQQKQLAALQREIISTERNLDKYTDQLNETEGETKQLTNAEEQAASASEKMSGGFSVLKGALANLVADGLRKAVDGFKDLMTAGPEFADNMLTLAQQTHLSTDTLQELSYMSGLVDVDVNTVAGSLKKLTKNMASAQGGTGSAADAFATLGVSVTDMNGNLRDNEDVFYDTINALGKVQNETERDALAMTIFGKSATDLNPLIEAGSDALKGFAEEAHEMGYVLDGDSLEALGKVQDEFDRFQKQMEGVKNQIAAGVAPALERGMKRIQQIVNNIDWGKVGEKIGDAFNGLIDAMEWIIDHGDLIKSILAGVIAAMAAQKVIAFTQAMMGMVSAMKAAMVAQEGLTAAMNANPITLLVTAIVAAGAALISWQKSLADTQAALDPYNIKIQEINATVDEHIEKIEENVDAYNELQEARDQSVSNGMAEMSYIQSLSDELATLADENGVVTDANTDRANFILHELNGALGTEYEMNGNIISQYQQMRDSIAQTIQQKQAQIVLNAQEAAMTEAIQQHQIAEAQLAETVNLQTQYENERAAVMERFNEVMAEVSAGNMNHMNELSGLQAEYDTLTGKLGELDTAYTQQSELVDKYAYDMTAYTDNMTKFVNGDYDSIAYTSWETAKAQGEASSEASSAITQNAKDSSNAWMTSIGDMLTESTGKNVEFKDVGEGMVAMYVNGIQQGESKPKNAIARMAGYALDEADIKTDMQTSGYNAVAGFVGGVEVNTWMAQGAGRNMADAFVNAFKARMDEGSPSKVMKHSGLMAILGFTNEVNDELAMVQQAGINMANAFTQPFNSNLDPTLNGNYSAMTASGMNGANAGMTSNDVTINVYGAEGQDVNLLADVVIDKLQRTINRSEGVYA